MLARAEPFLWFIVEAIELRNMPSEIALLPAVESGFNPHAKSAARARGLWQFVESTGKVYGLKENDHYDARRDAIASTRAALSYLQKLNVRFDDWLLALAAYNVGENAVGRAIEKSGKRSFWALDLPRETREHVPRLMGLALLIKQPERFGVSLPPILNRHVAEIIVLDSAKDLERVAKTAKVPLDVIERYNPGLKSLSNTRGKRWLVLPTEHAVNVRAVLAQREFKPKAAPPRRYHVVREGDSLWVLAREYKVSIKDLREWNQLGKKSLIKPGKKLVVSG